MKEKLSVVMLTVIAVLALSFTSLADDMPSVPEMINEIYANEANETWKDMAIDYAMVLTGYKAPLYVFDNGSALVCAYPVEPELEMSMEFSLLGTHAAEVGTFNDEAALFTDPDEPLTREAFAKNIADLKTIYNMVTEVRSATDGKDDIETLTYIEDYIESVAPTYVAGCDPVVAETVNNGYTDCDGYTALTYILGINCGLNISNVSGYVYNDKSCGHAWNNILLDGITYIHDTCWDITAKCETYLAALPEDLASEGRVRDDITYYLAAPAHTYTITY